MESAAVFSNAIQISSLPVIGRNDWLQTLNNRRYEDAMAAVTLTFNGFGGSKSRQTTNAPVLFMTQVATVVESTISRMVVGLVRDSLHIWWPTPRSAVPYLQSSARFVTEVREKDSFTLNKVLCKHL